MSGEIEVGHCDICKTPRVHIGRKYYRYDIKCTCCNGKDDDHFEIVYYCKNCEPQPPRMIHAHVKPKKN